MTKPIPSPAKRPDLYDAYDGSERPTNWRNPIALTARLQKLADEARAKKPARSAASRSYVVKIKNLSSMVEVQGESFLKVRPKRGRKVSRAKFGSPAAGTRKLGKNSA